jgi:hypothetical protein
MRGSSEPVLSFQDRAFDRIDLTLVAFIVGTWPAFESSVASGIAFERQSNHVGESVDDSAVRDLALAFRRARGLIAGDELHAWLAERDLSQAQWRAWLNRCVGRELGAPPPIGNQRTVSREEVAAIVLTDAIFDGILERSAATLIDWLSAARSPELGTASSRSVNSAERVTALTAEVASSAAAIALDLHATQISARLEPLCALEDAYERLIQQIATDAALSTTLRAHYIDWQRFDITELRFTDVAAAREAVMCVREDQLTPEEVASLGGAALNHTSILLAEAEPDLAPLLLSAHANDVLGPLAGEDGGNLVLQIQRRILPSLDDDELRQRSRDELIRTALEPLRAGMVRWHAHL